METLVISEQRRHCRKKASSAGSHFSSPQSIRGFQAGNCRGFHSGITIGILPLPPVPLPRAYSPEYKKPKQQQQHHGKKRSRAISISPSKSLPTRPQLWAGPGFSNSPPPSSLPLPKFSLHQKRSVSLEFPPDDQSNSEDVSVHAQSAPSSPTASSGLSLFSDSEQSGLSLFNDSDTDIATENLRRILHLEIANN